MELGERIACLRAASGLKSKELATLAGVKQSYISSIENGRKIPTVAVLQKIAHALGTTVSDLLGEERRLLSPSQKRLLSAAGGLNGVQLEAVINLICELKKGNASQKTNASDFLVAENEDN